MSGILILIILQFIWFFSFAIYMKLLDREFKLLHKRFDNLEFNKK